MILVDASVWIDHVRAPDADLGRLLSQNDVLTHPFVIGEIALGHVRSRKGVLAGLQVLDLAEMAEDAEVLRFIDRYGLYGLGIGYIDVHLLASTVLTLHASLWTRDKRLRAAAQRLGVAAKGLN
jgi:predicted nucleic acid-binding protein